MIDVIVFFVLVDMVVIFVYDLIVKQKVQVKMVCILIKVILIEKLKKFEWICVKVVIGSLCFNEIKMILCEYNLYIVCEEVSCLNIGECFGKGIVMFMIMGDKCMCCCLFCDVGYGCFDLFDVDELKNFVCMIVVFKFKYVVIMSVDCDDLCDGGVVYFVECICEVCEQLLDMCIEIFMLDFCGCFDCVILILNVVLFDVMNYNFEMVLCLYKEVCLGLDYVYLLKLLKDFKVQYLDVVMKLGLMVGFGEMEEEILQVMCDLCVYDVDMLMIGQYLQLFEYYLLVCVYVYLDIFKMYEEEVYKMGFMYVVVGVMVCLSYYVDLQVYGVGVV